MALTGAGVDEVVALVLVGIGELAWRFTVKLRKRSYSVLRIDIN